MRTISFVFVIIVMSLIVFTVAMPVITKPTAIDSYEGKSEIEEPQFSSVPLAHGTRSQYIEGTMMNETSPMYNITNWGNYLTIGVKFEVHYECTVDRLGIYTDDTYYVVYNLRLWIAETQTLIASFVYPFVLPNSWAWFDISPVNLYAGETYVVSARILSDSINCIDNPGPSPDGVINPTGFVYDYGNGFPSILYSESMLPLVDIHYFVSPNTPEGYNVEVNLGYGVTVNFQEVTSAGMTTCRVTEEGPAPSEGFKMVPTAPTRYYQIVTSAGYTGNITLKFKYLETWIPQNENETDLRIWRYEAPNWLDFTGAGFPDTVNNTLQGTLSSLSFFVLAIPIERPKELKESAITELENAKTGDKKIDKKIDRVIEHLDKGLEDKLWMDDTHLDHQHGHRAFDEDKATVKNIQELMRHKYTPDSVKDVCENAIEKLVKADELVAKKALEDAEAYAGTNKQVDHQIMLAEQELAKAKEALAKGEYDKAIDHYKKAWEHAQLAIYLASK